MLTFLQAVAKLKVERPYFLPPIQQKIRLQRAQIKAVVSMNIFRNEIMYSMTFRNGCQKHSMHIEKIL
jgi:hypothetical protein